MVCLWHRMWCWFHGYMLISKLIKLCALKMYSILYVIHMQIKWFKNIIRFRTIILLLNQDIVIITFAVSKCFCTIYASDEINATYEAIIQVFLLGFLLWGIFIFLKILKGFEFTCKIPGILEPVTCFHILSFTLF